MGIRGLTTFLAQYEGKYNETVYVRDGPIVIDGANLMFYLYHQSSGTTWGDNAFSRAPSTLGSPVGGDYIGFASRVRAFFQKLEQCALVPIVIFDGAYEKEKLPTVMDRFATNLKECLHHKRPGNSYAPIFLKIVFLEICVEQKVIHFQTQWEADDTLALVARKLNCPILSSDSDFRIYPNLLSIPLPSIEFKKSNKGQQKQGTGGKETTLIAKIVSLKKLCLEEFNFSDLRLIPLAAVVLGNDRISTSTFKNFHKGNNQVRADKYARIRYLFKWFGSHRDYDHVLATMLLSVKEVERGAVEELVKTVLRNYMEDSGGELHVWELVRKSIKFESIPEDIKCKGIQLETKTEVKVNAPPQWFLELHYSCALPSTLITILLNQTVLYRAQVEIPSMSSSHEIATPIVQVLGGLILEKGLDLTIVTRNRSQLVRETVEAIAKLKCFGPLPTIWDSGFRNKGVSIFMETLGFFDHEKDQKWISEWPPSAKVVVMSLVYFMKRTRKRDLARLVAIGVILSILKPMFSPTSTSTKKDDESNSVAELVKAQSLSGRLLQFYKKYGGANISVLHSKAYEIEPMYVYSQFQSVLFYSLLLNKLLGLPFRAPKIQTLNSQLVYNVIHSVRSEFGGKSDAWIKYVFGSSDSEIQSGNSDSYIVPLILNRFFDMTNAYSKDDNSMDSSSNTKEEVAVVQLAQKSEDSSYLDLDIQAIAGNQFAALALDSTSD